PQNDLEATWTPCEQAEALRFSAVAYYFGRELQKELNVPVGLIHSSWGGTPIEYWLNEKTMKADADMAVAYTNHEKAVANYPAAQKRYAEQLAAYKEAAAKAKAEGRPAPQAPRAVGNPTEKPPACLYNGMIAPMVPYA